MYASFYEQGGEEGRVVLIFRVCDMDDLSIIHDLAMSDGVNYWIQTLFVPHLNKSYIVKYDAYTLTDISRPTRQFSVDLQGSLL